ncbi:MULTISPECIES: ZPR1 zinc finger domain-containing protein [Methanothermobacter]|uniref:ZPR1 zinc finger domain-containing protein n=1 Tax=Methanothermobacter TaxID=145260 RepID=UPI0011CBF3AD|nr:MULTISPECIES: ZPR1 zinc finger domain-containing protein [unclassified Methanothermobacter]QEF94130.1 ZPR1 zinc finger domain-containing protein [Methanothermobacter sp. KEPCO-1]QHN08448.1 ZPR1 zinc finger domain-containing protein [Methanothermobacter sp. THM-2]
MNQQDMKIDCPVCSGEKCMTAISRVEKIPYFGEIMESVLICSRCGYRSTDIICLEQKEPSRYTIEVGDKTLNARVVKSQSATIRIPELGLKVEPGPRSTGYISNIEGVVERFETAVKTAINLFEEDESKEKASEILEMLREVRGGKRNVTVIIEDPFGQSFVGHPSAVREKLSDEEIKSLKTGFLVFESDEIDEED